MRIIKCKDEIAWEFLKVRVFIHDDKEIIEVYSETDESGDIVVAYHEAPIGDNLLSFCESSDSSEDSTLRVTEHLYEYIELLRKKKDAKANTTKLISYLEAVMLKKPYFACLYTSLTDQIDRKGKIDLDSLTWHVKSIEDLFDTCADTISNYLRVDENNVSDNPEEDLPSEIEPIWLPIEEVKFEPIYVDNGVPCVMTPEIYFEFTDNNIEVPEHTFDYVLYPTDTGRLFNYIIAEYIKRGVRVKKCKNCGGDFISHRNNQVDYCDRVISNTGKTCRQLGAIRVYQNKQNENPIMREYNKSYKTHNARIRYGTITKEEFAEWSVKAREMRQRCMDGEITLEEFIEWLKD